MLSGFVVVGDIRDISASICDGDGLGILLNALALIPGYGDAAKVTATISKFVAKHPHMIFAVAGFVVKHVDDSIDIVRKTYGDVIVDGLNTKGLTDNDITKLVKKSVDLDELKFVRKIGDDVVYITKERWDHIFGRHVNGIKKPNKATTFFPTGRKISSDLKRTEFILPKTMEDSDVVKVIFEATDKKNLKSTRFGDTIDEYTYNPGNHGISEMLVWVNKKTGRIESAHPKMGTSVWKWNGIQWKKVT